MNGKNKKILLDVTPLQLPFCGIQSDANAITRLLLESSYADDLSYVGGTIGKSPLFLRSRDLLLQEALWLAKLSEASNPGRFQAVMASIKSLFLLYKSRFILRPIQSSQLKDSYFRLFFGKDCWRNGQRERILKRPFLITNISQDLVIKKTLLPGCPVIRFDTSGYDLFLTHQDHMPSRVTSGTKYVIRYHDSIPILHPDLMKHADYSVKYRYAALKKAVALGAFFVCNSEQTQAELLLMFPELKDRICVIPPVVEGLSKTCDAETMVCLLREKTSPKLKKIIIESPAFSPADEIRDGHAEYIITVAPLDPKKNIVRLIKGFYGVRSRLRQNLKLVIVGSVGWKNKETLKLVLGGIKNGDIIWLQDVLRHELEILISHAKAFAFVSLEEGFGIPPIEAMLCGVPVVSSDIPVHRQVQQDAPLYCNPYDHSDIADAIAKVCDPAKNDLRAEMIEKGKVVSRQYSAANLQKQWEALLDEWTS